MKIAKRIWIFLVEWAKLISESKKLTTKNGYNGYY